MTLGNMREQGVHQLIAYCLNDSCRHQIIIDASSYPGDTPVMWFYSDWSVTLTSGIPPFAALSTHNRAETAIQVRAARRTGASNDRSRDANRLE
jgi:hypothetical protein